MQKSLPIRPSEVLLGAALIAFVYVSLTPGVLPEVVSWPPELPPGTVASLRWLVGLSLGVVIVGGWQLTRFALRAVQRPT